MTACLQQVRGGFCDAIDVARDVIVVEEDEAVAIEGGEGILSEVHQGGF